MKSFYLCAAGLLGLGLAAAAACSSDDSSTGGTGGTGAVGATGGTSQGGQAQGGQAQGGTAQGGTAQGGQAQGGNAQGGNAQGGQGQGGFVSGPDCQALCNAAQAGQCTQIVGDCGDFCDALLAVAPLAGCNFEASGYVDCLGEPQTVCTTDCATELQELRTCMTAYCYSHQDNEDCQTLADAFE